VISTPDTLLIVAWGLLVAYLVRETKRKPQSAARTGPRGRHLRARPGVGGMRERFTPPPRYGPGSKPEPEPSEAEGDSMAIEAYQLTAPDQFAAALAALTPSALCTPCVIELKQARATGQPDPEVHPGIVLSIVVINGVPTPAMLCEVRHQLDVGPTTPLVVAPANAVRDLDATIRAQRLAAPGTA